MDHWNIESSDRPAQPENCHVPCLVHLRRLETLLSVQHLEGTHQILFDTLCNNKQFWQEQDK